jgi:hypothetical protein
MHHLPAAAVIVLSVFWCNRVLWAMDSEGSGQPLWSVTLTDEISRLHFSPNMTHPFIHKASQPPSQPPMILPPLIRLDFKRLHAQPAADDVASSLSRSKSIHHACGCNIY